MPYTIDTTDLENLIGSYESNNALTRADVSKLVSDFGKLIDIPDLKLDRHGIVSLSIDDRVMVSLIYLPQFPGIVAMLEVTNDIITNVELQRQLLQANMDWSQTGGGAFAVIPKEKQSVLCRLIVLNDRDPRRLDFELTGLVDLVSKWNDELETEVLLCEGDSLQTETQHRLIQV